MDRFALIVNRDKDPSLTTATKICEALRARGALCEIAEDAIAVDVTCVLVLGGDGTMLQAARSLREMSLDIPLLGVNLGTLGYLAEVEKNGMEEALDQLVAGDYFIEERMMLQGAVYDRKGELLRAEASALNDIVITRSGSLQVIRLTVHVNGQELSRYQADGIILSTPTGSTGYNLSAGGPIVAPEAQMLLMTPISPHTLTNRSIVLSPTDRIRVEIGEGRDGGALSVEANFDGNLRMPMATGDSIEISRSHQVTKILRLKRVSFVEVLRQKLV